MNSKLVDVGFNQMRTSSTLIIQYKQDHKKMFIQTNTPPVVVVNIECQGKICTGTK